MAIIFISSNTTVSSFCLILLSKNLIDEMPRRKAVSCRQHRKRHARRTESRISSPFKLCEYGPAMNETFNCQPLVHSPSRAGRNRNQQSAVIQEKGLIPIIAYIQEDPNSQPLAETPSPYLRKRQRSAVPRSPSRGSP